jgi:hypothetical protein
MAMATIDTTITAHKHAKAALLSLLRDQGTMPDAIEAAHDTERNAVFGVIEKAATLPELLAGLRYLHKLVAAGDPIMGDHGKDLLEAIVTATERASRREPR